MKKNLADGKMWGGGKTVLAIAIAASFINGMTFGTLAANHQWASSGNVTYSKDGTSTTSFNRDDLDYLDLRIDQVENDVIQAKTDLATEINNWSLPIDKVLSSASSFSDINNALLYLRSVPNNGEICTDSSGSQVYLKESGGLTLSTDDAVSTDPVRYTKATADSLSAGTVAWSEGQLIVGNGADNESYYNRGYTDGFSKTDTASIEYTYHTHTTDCYETVDVYENVTRYKNCTGRVWDTPNDDDSFTCDKCKRKCHGYQYDNGSACPQKISYTSYEKTGTKEQLKCGKTTDTIESAIITF